MKKLFFFILFLFSSLVSYGQLDNQMEVYFYNTSDREVTVRCYPVSMVFNGYYQYNLISGVRAYCDKDIPTIMYYDYNNCVNITDNNINVDILIPNSVGSFEGLKFDAPNGNSSCQSVGAKGFGVYKFEFEYIVNNQTIRDSVIFEQDAGISYDTKFYIGNYNNEGLGLYYSAITPTQYNGPITKVVYTGDFQNYYIRTWNPYPYNAYGQRDKILGTFYYSNSSSNLYEYSTIPLDSRMELKS